MPLLEFEWKTWPIHGLRSLAWSLNLTWVSCRKAISVNMFFRCENTLDLLMWPPRPRTSNQFNHVTSWSLCICFRTSRLCCYRNRKIEEKKKTSDEGEKKCICAKKQGLETYELKGWRGMEGGGSPLLGPWCNRLVSLKLSRKRWDKMESPYWLESDYSCLYLFSLPSHFVNVPVSAHDFN